MGVSTTVTDTATKRNAMAPVHGYWSLRGLGQSIRLLLAHAGVDYEDKRYNIKGEAPNWDRSEWLTDKFSLGLDFPNNPYYIDGDVKLTQSMTIMKYLGRKYDLAPVTEGEHQRVDLIEAEAIDMRGAWGRTCYNPTSKICAMISSRVSSRSAN